VRELRLWTAAAAAPATAVGFYALAVLRRRRSLHPSGVGYQGQLVVGDGPGRLGVPLLRPGAAYHVLLRFPGAPACPSRCLTPLAWPSSCPTSTVPAPTRIYC
jgi:hypothetical protein